MRRDEIGPHPSETVVKRWSFTDKLERRKRSGYT